MSYCSAGSRDPEMSTALLESRILRSTGPTSWIRSCRRQLAQINRAPTKPTATKIRYASDPRAAAPTPAM